MISVESLRNWRTPLAPALCCVLLTAASLVTGNALAASSAAAKANTAKSTPASKPTAAMTAVPTADDFCVALVRRIPGLSTAQCQSAGLRDSGARSVRGAPLMLRDIEADASSAAPATTALRTANDAATSALELAGSVPQGTGGATPTGTSAASSVPSAAAAAAQATPGSDNGPRYTPPMPRRVLVLGAIHGDELTATTLAMAWLRAADAAAPQDLSRRIHWRFVPALNPDGVLGLKPSRTNARGVDLNRNFPTPEWETKAPKWWQESTRRDPRRFPGHTALSEPEARWVHDEMASWDPDLIVSIHAPFGVLDFDGPVDPPKRLGRLWLEPVGVYPGSLGNYGGLHKGVPVLTIELSHALKPPPEAEMQTMWRDMMAWIERRWGERLAASPAGGTPQAR